MIPMGSKNEVGQLAVIPSGSIAGTSTRPVVHFAYHRLFSLTASRYIARPPIRVTDRLILNMPAFDDAKLIFETYASDPAVTAYVGWPRHLNIDDTRAFIEFANAEWSRSSIGPYLIRDRQDGTLIGSTGICCNGITDAMTGYVLAKANWGNGFATEVVREMIGVAHQLELHSLFALCHPERLASRRVLEKAGFRLDSTWSETITFPNLDGGQSTIPVCYRQSLSH